LLPFAGVIEFVTRLFSDEQEIFFHDKHHIPIGRVGSMFITDKTLSAGVVLHVFLYSA